VKRLLAVGIAIAVMTFVRRTSAPASDIAATALALGFTLMAAMVAGELLRRFRLPRLTGYLLFGVAVGPYLGNVITEGMARQLQIVNGLATVLIAFIAGLTLNFERIGRRLRGVGTFIAVTLGASMGLLFMVLWIAWRWLPIDPGASGVRQLVMIGLLVTIAVSFSPTMTAAVISETGARGRVAETVLATVVVADLVALVLFSLLMQVARVALADQVAGDVAMLVRLAWEIGGAVAFGALVGALFALYLRYVSREVTFVLLGVCVVLSQVGAAQQLAPLLAAMSAGLVIQNAAVPQGEALKSAIQRGALPVLVVFFVSVGVSLQVQTLTSIGVVALVLAVSRFAIIQLGVIAGTNAAGLNSGLRIPIWSGLISQAGITLGFASVMATEFPDWGGRVQTLLIALIAIDELLGPSLFRMGLARAGELDSRAERPLIVVSNREPYLHSYGREGEIRVAPATGGVAVALDALMRERRGVWIAHADGAADKAVVGPGDKVRVPPEAASYDLRRLWVDREQYSAYYGGFANEGLWPLCHLVDVRPKFRTEDWSAYDRVNAQFAAVVAEELDGSDPPVFIQDYHLATVAAHLRARRPSVRTALFWHIPWPYPDRLRICPWRREILAGLLANDFLAFQLERDRRNFLLAVDEELGASIEADGEAVRWNGRMTTVVDVPIGVDYDRIQAIGADPVVASEQQRLADTFGLRARLVGLGVDRLDYTKGIPERLDALDRVFARRPDLRGVLTFVQIGVPSRSDLAGYRSIADDIERKVADLNARYGQPGLPPPIVYHKAPLELPSLVALYRLAQFCIVSSLHDGMNLVAKEFVAAREDEDGVLVLSALTGAAQELRDALIINPYDADRFADAILQAVDMLPQERRRRMRNMRRVVAGRNVFSWASDILEGLESLWTRPLQYAARAPQDAPV
jgi:trehalose-6-phosphate synthase/Kef-type K+ transport system membrane component KefB